MSSRIFHTLKYLKRCALNQIIDMKLENMRHHGEMAKIIMDLLSSRKNLPPLTMLRRIIDIEINLAGMYPKIAIQPYFSIVVQPMANYACWVHIKSEPNKRLNVYALRDITKIDLSEATFL